MSRHTDLRKHNGPRKRTGCATCKSAHVKCTEEKPHCRRCGRLKLRCDYEFILLWEEDSVQRGIVHGRTGVWSRDGKKPGPARRPFDDHPWIETILAFGTGADNWEFVNFGVEDFANGVPQVLYDDERGQEIFVDTAQSAGATSCFQTPSLPLSEGNLSGALSHHDANEADEEHGIPPERRSASSHWSILHIAPAIATHDLTNLETLLLDYYVRSLAPKCSLSNDLNPYLEILLPVACEFAPLRHTLLAASACQLFHFSDRKVFEIQSLRHRSKAIRGLNEHLGRGKVDWQSLATMAMFCFRDITDGCEPTWITHLRMGLRMLRELSYNAKTDIGLQQFCEMYFVAHEVMGRTAWSDAKGEIDVYEWEKNASCHEIDVMMGCSRELISLVSQVSRLATKMQNHPGSHAQHIIEAKHTFSQITSLKQTPRHPSGGAETMVQIAEIKRLSALLYFHDRVVSQLPLSRFSLSGPHAVADLQKSIISSLELLPPSSGATLWPLFVLGNSKLRDTSQVRFVIDRLMRLEASRYLGSVHHARRRVERDLRRRSMELHGHEEIGDTWRGSGIMCENERWISLA